MGKNIEMADQLPKYGLRESDEFQKCVNSLVGGYKRWDDAQLGITWALSYNPHVYPVVQGMQDIRLLKTDVAGDMPALRIWFRINEPEERVELLFLDAVPDDTDDN